MATGVVACPEDYSIENEEITAYETYLNIYVKFQPVKTSVEEVLSQNVNVYGGEQVIVDELCANTNCPYLLNSTS